jgi:hypothetical protein
MVSAAIWGGIAGLLVTALEWLGLVGSYANSTDSPVIIVGGVGVGAGVVFGIVAARDARWRECRMTSVD